MQSIEIEFNVQQANRQSINSTRRIIGLLPIRDLIELIDKLDLNANPRDSKKSTITEEIKTTLRTEPEIFPLKSKGILIAGSNFSEKPNGAILITFSNFQKEGILDGGHNLLAIGQYILEESLENANQKIKLSSRIWRDFKKDFKKFYPLVLKYAESDRGKRALSTLISIELLLPKSDSPNALLDYNQSLTSIQTARNNNAQVKLGALSNNDKLYDDLKKQLPAILTTRVEWRTNEGKPIKSEDVIAFTWIPLNALLIDMKRKDKYLHDSDSKKIQPLNPPQIYSSKASCVKQFRKLSNSPDLKNSQMNRDLLDSVYKIAGEIPNLFDHIYKIFPTEFDRYSSKKFRSIPYVKNYSEKIVAKKTPFFDSSVEYVFPEAYIYPIIYSLNKLIKVGSTVTWKVDPIDFLNKNLANILSEFDTNYMKSERYEPQKIGKRKDIYIFLEKVVENLI